MKKRAGNKVPVKTPPPERAVKLIDVALQDLMSKDIEFTNELNFSVKHRGKQIEAA